MGGCQIIIENATNFFPGGIVSGKVVCNFNSRKEIRGIKIKFRGREHTSWSKTTRHYDSRTKKHRNETVNYTGDNKFIQAQLNVADAGSVGPDTFEYPFQFLIPNQCPGSYKSFHGRVWYYIKATVDIPRGRDYEQTVDINVVSPIDFNTRPDINMNPTNYHQEEVLACCCCCRCCSNGPLTINLNLDKEAFVLGEAMRLQIHISNLSSESIKSLDIQLHMHVKEFVTLPSPDSKYSERLLARLSDTGVGAHGDRNYDLQLQIPADVILPNFTLCRLFQSWYTIKVEAEIPGCYKNKNITAGITLGHVPLITGARIMQPVYVDGASYPAAPPAPYPPNNPIPPYPVPSLHGKELPGVHTSMPMPTPGEPFGPSSSSAPIEVEAPSAPSKVPFVEEDDFETVGRGKQPRQPPSRQPPPPSYFDAVGLPPPK